MSPDSVLQYAATSTETGRAAANTLSRPPPHFRNHGALERRGRENGQQYAGALRGGFYAGHLRPRDNRRPTQSGADDGEYPLLCGIGLSTIRSRWGQRSGQEKAVSEKRNK